MGTLTLTDPVQGTVTDANIIASNNAAIKAVVNGGIDNTNIANAASIAYSKLVLTGSVVKADMAAGNKTTVSTMAGGPPGSPADGDIWIATAVDANGTRWAFQYNAGSASAYKWEFIGGPPTRAIVSSEEGPATAGSYQDLATVGPSITLARAGDYQVQFMAHTNIDQTVVAAANIGVFYSGAIQVTADNVVLRTAGDEITFLYDAVLTGVPAATATKMQYNIGTRTSGGYPRFRNRVLKYLPIRIS